MWSVFFARYMRSPARRPMSFRCVVPGGRRLDRDVVSVVVMSASEQVYLLLILVFLQLLRRKARVTQGILCFEMDAGK